VSAPVSNSHILARVEPARPIGRPLVSDQRIPRAVACGLAVYSLPELPSVRALDTKVAAAGVQRAGFFKIDWLPHGKPPRLEIPMSYYTPLADKVALNEET
jgi:hypothetical protein